MMLSGAEEQCENASCDITRTRGPLETHRWNVDKKLTALFTSVPMFKFTNGSTWNPCLSKARHSFKNEHVNVDFGRSTIKPVWKPKLQDPQSKGLGNIQVCHCSD